MAALHHGAAATATAIHHRRLKPENTSLVKPVFFVSSFSSSFSDKRTRRKNHLREKILKTLKNPIIPELPPANLITPIESPSQEVNEIDIIQEIQEFELSETLELAEDEEIQELQEFKEVEVEVSAPAGVGIDGRIDVAGKDQFLKYGLWFVGAFVFQTVCAVLFFGLDDNDNERKIVNGSGELRAKDAVLDENGKMEGSFDVEMERKIEEIRLMARAVRERERLQSKGNDEEGKDEGEHVKSGIEEEVDGTMVRLRKKLEKTRFKEPLVGKNSSLEAKNSEEFEKGGLLYKKKYKFRDFSGDTIDKPKGFVGSDDSRVNGDIDERNGDDNADGSGVGQKQTKLSDDGLKGIDAVDVVEEDTKKGMLETTKPTRNTRSKVTKERGTSKEGKKKGITKPNAIDDNALEKNKRGSNLEAVKSSKLNVKAVKLATSIDLDTAVVSDQTSAGNGSLRGKGFGNTKSATKSKSETGLWWSNLPYVLVIFMQRGTGGEGLYTLKTPSNTEDQISYTVAFEDRTDATNFCYLLESFFEELGDFNAEVVPLTVKELKEAVKSYSLRPLVVKRGKLQLYAGQPLSDAEMALRAMID